MIKLAGSGIGLHDYGLPFRYQWNELPSQIQPSARQPFFAAAIMSANCAHLLKLIKTDNTLIQWTCEFCRYWTNWWTFECKYCKIHIYRACAQERKVLILVLLS